MHRADVAKHIARQRSEAECLEKERHALLDPARLEYIARIRQRVERNRLRPPGLPSRLECVVRVSQIPGGEVVRAEIRTSSGNVAFDRSKERSRTFCQYR